MQKLFIGPMSLNTVNVVAKYPDKIGFIPSRRQIEYNGGYVNNWTTKQFTEYIKNINPLCVIERDHGGPAQGSTMDNGLISFQDDCNHMNIIHIDPWKKHQNFKDGLDTTVDLINFCYKINPNMLFEVGTEEAIRPTTPDELDCMLSELKDRLSNVFNQIKYVVIQSGTSLEGTKNTGVYDEERLRKMIKVCKKYGKLSKEHNGDFIETDVLKNKMSCGLDAINIAPEFGQLETKTILDNISNQDTIDILFELCLKSKKWVKWVNNDFDPHTNKLKLIIVCGHYLFCDKTFIAIKNQIPEIDKKINIVLTNRIESLLSIIYN
mgnify:CR=1 FL=1